LLCIDYTAVDLATLVNTRDLVTDMINQQHAAHIYPPRKERERERDRGRVRGEREAQIVCRKMTKR
jgi:hypothetical protein